MPHLNDYLGMTWALGGNPAEGSADCYTLSRHYLLQELGITLDPLEPLPEREDEYPTVTIIRGIHDNFEGLRSTWIDVPPDELIKGDVILYGRNFLATHMGVYIGDEQCLSIGPGAPSGVLHYKRLGGYEIIRVVRHLSQFDDRELELRDGEPAFKETPADLQLARLRQNPARLERWRKEAIVTRFQAKAALHQFGMLSTVEGYIEQSSDYIIKLAWNEARFERMSNLVANVSQALGMTDEQLDELFFAAALIRV